MVSRVPLIALTSALLVIIAMPMFLASAGTLAFVNGGFETGDLTGWTEGAFSPATTSGMGLTSTQSHSGTYSFLFVANGQYINQSFATPIVPTSDLTFYVKLSDFSAHEILVIVTLSDGSEHGLFTNMYGSADSNGWKLYTQPLSGLQQYGNLAIKRICFEDQVTGDSPNGNDYIDDISLQTNTPISSTTPSPTPSILEFPSLAILMLFMAVIIIFSIAVVIREQHSKIPKKP